MKVHVAQTELEAQAIQRQLEFAGIKTKVVKCYHLETEPVAKMKTVVIPLSVSELQLN